jgi:pyroglutamyl-peptidase
MRTLLTGFGPFPGVADNPSGRIAEHFAAAPGQFELVARVLPVSFQRTSALVPDLLGAGDPFHAALLLGVASRAREMRLERFAHNRDGLSHADVDGFVPKAETIADGAPARYETVAALAPLRERLAADGMPVCISEDAGRYVCNHAYFTALHAIHQGGLPTRCLFLHLPPASPTLTIEQQIAAVQTAIEYLSKG